MRLPVLPTLIVALAAATMIGLGIWQLERAQWKEKLLADYAAAAALPAVDLDPLFDRGVPPTLPLAYRRVLVSCRFGAALPEMRAGHNAQDETGYAHLVPCRPGAAGLAGRLLVNIGWSPGPDASVRAPTGGLVAGRLGAVPDDGPVMLVSAAAQPPLQPAAAPSLAEIPNNHLFYAFQWFFFAAAAAIIYLLALRRRQKGAVLADPPTGS